MAALPVALSNGLNTVPRILMGFLSNKMCRVSTMIVTLFLSDLNVLTFVVERKANSVTGCDLQCHAWCL